MNVDKAYEQLLRQKVKAVSTTLNMITVELACMTTGTPLDSTNYSELESEANREQNIYDGQKAMFDTMHK